jgi:hypothetical protein
MEKVDDMSSAIQPPEGPSGIPAAGPLRRSEAARRVDEQSALNEIGNEAPVSIDAIPSAPPPEVLAQMKAAGEAYAALQSEGYEVHYSHDPLTHKVTAELRDREGAVVRTLTPSEAIALATGEALPTRR